MPQTMPNSLYRAIITKEHSIEVLVAADSPSEARIIVQNNRREIERDFYDSEYELCVDISDKVHFTPEVIKEIKDYGVFWLGQLPRHTRFYRTDRGTREEKN